jgi:D-3-phosphoglycerate dehydrogenase
MSSGRDEGNLVSLRVLLTDRFDLDAYASLASMSEFKVRKAETFLPTPGELKETDALIIRSRTKIDVDLLNAAPALKLIITTTSGFDHIDLALTTERNVKVMYTPDANAASATELTWALVLASARRIIESHRAVKNGDWKRELLVGRELAGKVYGIIGLGRIGSRVAKVAQAFGMQVIAFDPYRDAPYFRERDVECLALSEVFRMSDVISCHVPATRETHHMIGPDHFENAERDLIFVNTSRGSIVTETTLIDALNENWLAGVGLDVFEREPLAKAARIANHPRAVLSPHIGANTSEAFRAASFEAVDKLKAFAAHGAISDPLPSTELWAHGGFRVGEGEA